MKTIKLIAVFAIVIAGIVACQKSGVKQNPTVLSYSEKVEESALRPVPQKVINVTGNQATEIVKKFKHLNESTQSTQARLIAADSVALDSSIFVVEAALNYDFDYHSNDPSHQLNDMQMDTTEYTIPITRVNSKVSSNDLETAYNQLSSFVNSTLNDTIKVKIIDIQAYFVGTNQITYRALVVKHITPGIEYWCGTNTSNGLAVNANQQLPSPAINILLYYLHHCDFPLTDCTNSFYINAQTLTWNNFSNTYPTSLYYAYFPPVLSTIDNTILTSTQINNYRAGCVSLAQSAITTPIAPVTSNHKVVAVGINNYNYWNTYQGSWTLQRTYWELNVTYGIVINSCY